jgi:hypothetical protein
MSCKPLRQLDYAYGVSENRALFDAFNRLDTAIEGNFIRTAREIGKEYQFQHLINLKASKQRISQRLTRHDPLRGVQIHHLLDEIFERRVVNI